MTISNDQGVDLTWYKARRSNGSGACVEVATAAGSILVRDSKDPHGPVLTYTKAEWDAFLDGAKKGEFDSFCV
jgi:predicted secreted Zn-dependent protease